MGVLVAVGVGETVTVAVGVAVSVTDGVAVDVGVTVGGIHAPKLTRTLAELVTRISNLSPVVDVYPIGFSRTRVYQPGARPPNSNRPSAAVINGGRAGGPGSWCAESYRKSVAPASPWASGSMMPSPIASFQTRPKILPGNGVAVGVGVTVGVEVGVGVRVGVGVGGGRQ